MHRIVLDSSIWVRGTISKMGAAGYIIQAWREGRVEVVVSRDILAETFEVLRRPHIQRRRKLTDDQKRRVITLMAKYGHMVEPTTETAVVTDDPDDDKIIGAAVDGNASFIISGDRHLQALEEYRGITVIDAPEFAQLLRSETEKQ